jgi:predicted DNA-binding protein
MLQNQQQTHWVQLPIRLESNFADQLDRYSRATRIPKAEIARSSIRRFLVELERSGARATLEKMHSADSEA